MNLRYVFCLLVTCSTIVSAETTDTTRTILFRNITPYVFTIEDRSTNESWSVNSSTYEKIRLHTQLPTSVEPTVTDEEATTNTGNTSGEIPFPHHITITYQHDGTTENMSNCLSSFPEQDIIMQTFMGNTGLHCVVSEYHPSQ